MRIALVNQWYPPDYGGIGLYNAFMAQSYAELGHEVTVITARTQPEQVGTSQENGILVHRLDRWVEPYAVRRMPLVGRHMRSFRHLAYALKAWRVLRHLAGILRVDVVEFAEINAEGLFYVRAGDHVPAVRTGL